MLKIISEKLFQTKAEEIMQFLNQYRFDFNSVDLHLNVGEQIILKDSINNKLCIDPINNKSDYRRKHKGKNELLAKAFGKEKGNKTVLDLTVGLGIDFNFIEQLGFNVFGVERNPLLFVLLNEAFNKTELKIHFSSAINYLNEVQKNELIYDVIYFDPMYPLKKKSALPKQEMVLFRKLVGDDLDSGEVLVKALELLKKGTKRVVVKRPLKAEPLLPTDKFPIRIQYKGNIVRYDVY